MEENNLENKEFKPKAVKKSRTRHKKAAPKEEKEAPSKSGKVKIIGVKAPLEEGREYNAGKANAETLVNAGAAKYVD